MGTEPWQPGDGLHCSHAKKAPLGMPCGRPVATISKPFDVVGRRSTTRKYVVCAAHLPGLEAPGQISARAVLAAKEQVLADHWEEYSALRDRLIQQFAEESLSNLPEELREIARRAVER